MEVHLLRTNKWKTTHDFPDNQKLRRFCLTLSGEARLWYETLGAQQMQKCHNRLSRPTGMLLTPVFKIWQHYRTVFPCLEIFPF